MTAVIWSPKSLRDLDDIKAYVAQRNPTAAQRLVKKIVRRMDRIELFPNSGGYVEEDDSRRYRQVLLDPDSIDPGGR